MNCLRGISVFFFPSGSQNDTTPQEAYMIQSGGYSPGVPPLPIPNREVKPDHADGTAHKVGE